MTAEDAAVAAALDRLLDPLESLAREEFASEEGEFASEEGEFASEEGDAVPTGAPASSELDGRAVGPFPRPTDADGRRSSSHASPDTDMQGTTGWSFGLVAAFALGIAVCAAVFFSLEYGPDLLRYLFER